MAQEHPFAPIEETKRGQCRLAPLLYERRGRYRSGVSSRPTRLIAGPPSNLVRTALPRMGAVGKGNQLLVESLVVVAGFYGTAIFRCLHALDPIDGRGISRQFIVGVG